MSTEESSRRLARLRNVVLCPEAVGVVVVSSLLVVAGDLELAAHREPGCWAFLVAHIAMLVLILVKAVEVYHRRTRIGRRHTFEHCQHV